MVKDEFYIKNKLLFAICVLFGLTFAFGVLGLPLIALFSPATAKTIASSITVLDGEFQGIVPGFLFVLAAVLFTVFGYFSIGEKIEIKERLDGS